MIDQHYLAIFQKAANSLDKRKLAKNQLEVAVGEVLNSIFLKLYKKSWTNQSQHPLTADSRIFFSIWVNDSKLDQEQLFYNIHALKLRQLKGYQIKSRNFADSFRKRFKEHEHNWQHVSVQFGPLTLMEGWYRINAENLQSDVVKLANKFIEIAHLIDNTLDEYRC